MKILETFQTGSYSMPFCSKIISERCPLRNQQQKNRRNPYHHQVHHLPFEYEFFRAFSLLVCVKYPFFFESGVVYTIISLKLEKILSLLFLFPLKFPPIQKIEVFNSLYFIEEKWDIIPFAKERLDESVDRRETLLSF